MSWSKSLLTLTYTTPDSGFTRKQLDSDWMGSQMCVYGCVGMQVALFAWFVLSNFSVCYDYYG